MTPVTTSVEELDENKVRLHVSIPAAEFERAIDAAFRKLAREVKIPGFRPGKAPRKLLEARLGADVARDQALRDALPDYYTQAVESEALDTIAAPEIDIIAGEDSGDVEFDAVVEVRPVVELSDYEGLRVEVPAPAVTDEAVDAQVDALRDRFADLEDSARPLAEGDYAQIDIRGYVHDEAVDALTATDYLYEVGSGLLVPKLDEELTGKRPGDILKFNDKLPERFGERAGEEVAFQVLVKEAKRKVLPDLTGEWASEASEFETVEELRADIRRRIELVSRVQAQMAARDKVLDAVSELVTIDLPDALVQREMEQRLHDMAHRLEGQGVTLQQYLAATGTEEQDLLQQVRTSAERGVRADLALRAVAAQEDVEVSDQELDEEIERIAERLQEKPAKVRRDLERRGILEAVRSDIARGKALRFLVDHADVVDEAGNTLDLKVPEGEPSPTQDQAEQTGETGDTDQTDQAEQASGGDAGSGPSKERVEEPQA
jgi:trigger factor